MGSDGTLRWITQAVDDAGNVAISTNRGALNVVSATAPAFDAGADATVELGERFTRTVAISDADSSRWTATLDTGEGPEPVDVLGDRVVVDIAPRTSASTRPRSRSATTATGAPPTPSCSTSSPTPRRTQR